MKTITIDIGNTRVKVAIFDENGGLLDLFTDPDLSELLARFAYDSKDTATWRPSDNSGFGANGTAWAYIGLTYGRELINKKKNYLKAAITLKANFGLLNNTFQSDNLYVDVFNRDFARKANGTMNTYYSNAFYSDNKFQTPSFGLNNLGFGADIGLIYEKRDGRDYKYEMDCKSDNLRNDLNKYKYRIGISVIDFGQVAFNSSIPLSSITFGVDYSQQEAFRYTGNFVVQSNTANIVGSGITINRSWVGNIINLTSVGSGSAISGYYNIVSIGGTVATLDRSAGTAGSASTGFVGGCFLSPGLAAGLSVLGNRTYIRNGIVNIFPVPVLNSFLLQYYS
jgi:hypothetical protein